ncbi:MAG: hypothetical protein H7Z14_15680 [Anaerolineae bacterium]|nr:hypothetical protein [Phycisphaerae bacterium]
MRHIVAAFVLLVFAFGSLTRAEELKQRQATIKGMVVRQVGNGKYTGLAVGIVATAGKEAKNGQVTIEGKIGDEMKSALTEAEKYVRVNHADLGNAQITISFEERYHPKDGGSAGTAFSVLLRSLVEGFEIDSAAAITGDIAVNGKVMPIGGVTAKLRGVMDDGCTIAVIPADNIPAVSDLLVRGSEMMEILRGLQVFSVAKVDDAVAITRSDRADKLKEAIKLYGELQKDMSRGVTALKTPAAQQKLGTILDLAPNHVSARYALDIAKGNGPRTLTRNASVVEIFAAAYPFWEVVTDKNKKDITRAELPVETIKSMKADLNSIKRVTHPDVEGLRKSMLVWIDTIDTILSSAGKQVTERDVKIVDQRRDALVKELKRLNSDEALVAKMMREGY